MVGGNQLEEGGDDSDEDDNDDTRRRFWERSWDKIVIRREQLKATLKSYKND